MISFITYPTTQHTKLEIYVCHSARFSARRPKRPSTTTTTTMLNSRQCDFCQFWSISGETVCCKFGAQVTWNKKKRIQSTRYIFAVQWSVEKCWLGKSSQHDKFVTFEISNIHSNFSMDKMIKMKNYFTCCRKYHEVLSFLLMNSFSPLWNIYLSAWFKRKF